MRLGTDFGSGWTGNEKKKRPPRNFITTLLPSSVPSIEGKLAGFGAADTVLVKKYWAWVIIEARRLVTFEESLVESMRMKFKCQ